jgi:hypothetical protein
MLRCDVLCCGGDVGSVQVQSKFSWPTRHFQPGLQLLYSHPESSINLGDVPDEQLFFHLGDSRTCVASGQDTARTQLLRLVTLRQPRPLLFRPLLLTRLLLSM